MSTLKLTPQTTLTTSYLHSMKGKISSHRNDNNINVKTLVEELSNKITNVNSIAEL